MIAKEHIAEERMGTTIRPAPRSMPKRRSIYSVRK